MKRIVMTLAVLGLAACGVLPASAPQPAQHDIGSGFVPQAGSAVLPLRNLSVSAAPIVGGLSMYYREAANPTRRGVYTYNRWAASPASLVENALVRLMPFESGGRCRLTVVVSDVIVELGANGEGSALLATELRLTADGRSGAKHRVSDIRVPVPKVEPASMALAVREAVIRLGGDAARWIKSDAAEFCQHGSAQM